MGSTAFDEFCAALVKRPFPAPSDSDDGAARLVRLVGGLTLDYTVLNYAQYIREVGPLHSAASRAGLTGRAGGRNTYRGARRVCPSRRCAPSPELKAETKLIGRCASVSGRPTLRSTRTRRWTRRGVRGSSRCARSGGISRYVPFFPFPPPLPSPLPDRLPPLPPFASHAYEREKSVRNSDISRRRPPRPTRTSRASSRACSTSRTSRGFAPTCAPPLPPALRC